MSVTIEEDFQKAMQRLLKAKNSLHPGEKTQIISLLGCKGGAGVTFIAVNLAQCLAEPAGTGAAAGPGPAGRRYVLVFGSCSPAIPF